MARHKAVLCTLPDRLESGRPGGGQAGAVAPAEQPAGQHRWSRPAGCELVDWYRARWEIELLFLILKKGCRVERLQLSDRDRLDSALAIYMVIAWRINRLMRLGRTVPELDAGLVFEPDEWRAAFIWNKRAVPEKMATLNEVICLIARRAGFLARKGDGEPGARTLWLGLQEIAIFVEGG